MSYCRIHGQIPASKRSKVLVEFERSSNVRTLLITLGTGAVGYVMPPRIYAGLLNTSQAQQAQGRQSDTHSRTTVEPFGRKSGHRSCA